MKKIALWIAITNLVFGIFSYSANATEKSKKTIESDQDVQEPKRNPIAEQRLQKQRKMHLAKDGKESAGDKRRKILAKRRRNTPPVTAPKEGADLPPPSQTN